MFAMLSQSFSASDVHLGFKVFFVNVCGYGFLFMKYRLIYRTHGGIEYEYVHVTMPSLPVTKPKKLDGWVNKVICQRLADPRPFHRK